ncbi:MAG: hypothetical protein HY369_04985 [Candidatus Aenigmarchaeota archaeon]|nr:hypothetical protein [Candidatus Aenigmarchaeota archaeon]
MPKYKPPETGAKFDTENEYRERKLREYDLEFQGTERPLFEEKPLRPEKEAREIIREVPQTMPRLEETAIKPLKLIGAEVIGSIFDRVGFLKTRIEEIQGSLALRETIHRQMMEEIDQDVREKQEMAARAADLNERRNLKMDMSVLRKEKRNENVQYWRDVVELKSELREFLEKFETESKIVALFTSIGGEPV